MGIKKLFSRGVFCLGLLLWSMFVNAGERTLTIHKKYLNMPVSHQMDRNRMQFKLGDDVKRDFTIRLATDHPEYWIFCDMSEFMGKTLTVSYPDGKDDGLKLIYQSDEIAGSDSLYKEQNRPQFHFTTRRGWSNDPNGLVYYEGQYHLFYQHNPYERDWGNLHWGHAVSKDLIHWEEMPVVLYPDSLGLVFSGSAIIDYKNAAGFNKDGIPAMIAFYTGAAAKQVQCLAWSLDNGRTFTKYDGNPIIDSKEKWQSGDTRDPKVFWHEPSGKWVMVLYEKDGQSIYNSDDLKKWTYKSHTSGFYECPELFELPVDGDINTTKWVMCGAGGTYMIGEFDGERFIPEYGKFQYANAIYAPQTYNDVPDGRRIQLSWGRVSHPGMPFNSMITFPTELTLRSTPNGIRMYSFPIKELDLLQTKRGIWNNLSIAEANEIMKPFSDEACLHIRTTMRYSHPVNGGLKLDGQNLFSYDMTFNLVNGVFYTPLDMTSMEITVDILLDKTSVEVFIDDGALSFYMERKAMEKNKDGFLFWEVYPNEIVNLEIYSIESIWNKSTD